MTFMAVSQGWEKCAGTVASYDKPPKSPSQHFSLLKSVSSCGIQKVAAGGWGGGGGETGQNKEHIHS